MHNPEYHTGSPDMKKTLTKENKLYKNAITNEVGDLKEDAMRVGKYALVAGGVALGAYLLYQYLNKEEETEKSQSPELAKPMQDASIGKQVVVEKEVKENPVLGYIKEQLAFLAITILREKLSDITGIDKSKLIKTPDEPSKTLIKNKEKGQKSFAVLLDPDKLTDEGADQVIRLGKACSIDYFFVGGSLLTNDSFTALVEKIKKQTEIPVIIFPGSNLQISSEADALLLLSLISGRNPEFLIGQHVVAAPTLKKSGLEIIATGYMLVDCGKPTTVSYISNTTPIPYDKPSVAVCTAMAGEMLGMKAIYMDGGSGALKPVSIEMIRQVKSAIDVPLIVGGGINTIDKAKASLEAGADVLVVGNAIEEKSDFLKEVAELVRGMRG